jgi:hypothetical protein
MPKLICSTYSSNTLIKIENTLEKSILDKLYLLDIKDWIYIIFDGKHLLVNDSYLSPRDGHSNKSMRRLTTSGLDVTRQTSV